MNADVPDEEDFCVKTAFRIDVDENREASAQTHIADAKMHATCRFKKHANVGA